MNYLVYITCPEQGQAILLAHTLVEAGLAAGVNVLPGATSVYRWQGQIHERRECLLFAQVSGGRLADFIDAAASAHSDTTPCIVALEIGAGNESFLAWIDQNGQGASCA